MLVSFPLDLEALDMGEADLCSLLDNLKFVPNLRSLSLMGNPQGQAVTLMVPYLLNQRHLGFLDFSTRVLFRRTSELCSGGDQSEKD